MSRSSELRDLAERIVDCLQLGCDRIEIAGALRRGAPNPSDVDIVCQPKTETILDLWGEPAGQSTMRFDRRRERLEELFDLVKIKDEQRLFTYATPELDASIDLFVVLPPAQWGALLAIRTGPTGFARLCVTSRLDGGAMPPGMRQEDGQLWRHGAPVATPEEADWFREIGLPCWPPSERSVERLKAHLGREAMQR